MRILRRIVIVITAVLVVAFVAVRWGLPVALSFYAVQKAPPVVRIVPTDLNDWAISKATGLKLSYFSYQFEIPWTDLDESKTEFFPKDKAEKNGVDLRFRSGLRLYFVAVPPRELVDTLSRETGVSRDAIERAFGYEMMKSDYNFVNALYEFTPDKMNHWDFKRGPLNRDEFLLLLKSIVPAKGADSGIFKIHNQSYEGFQQGSCRSRQDRITIDLYSDDGGAEFTYSKTSTKTCRSDATGT